MSSIALPWSEINAYRAAVGPGVGRPPRPQRCPHCDGQRIWFNGWRLVFASALADGKPHRFEDGLPIQRVKCAQCRRSWSLRPAFLYPHRSFEPDVNELASLAYLLAPEATYARVAERFGCSPRSVWRWVGWLATLVVPALLIAQVTQLDASSPAFSLVPRSVPAAHRKARSAQREDMLLRALQTLVALGLYARAQPHPPDDPSPLRFWLTVQYRPRGQLARLVDASTSTSPAVPEAVRVPDG